MVSAPPPPPCHRTCPAGIDAPRYIRLIAQRRFAEAAAVIREKVPFPLVLGYACSGPCEASCRCGQGRLPLAIRALKRFAAERDLGAPPDVAVRPPTGKRVVVVGSGPGGLTAAYYLACCGHDVTVLESAPEPGGMLRTGIPEFRLPRRVVDAEIEGIRRAGVRIRTGTTVRSCDELLDAGPDVVLLAMGLPRSRRLDIPGVHLRGVQRGLAFLRAVNAGSPPAIGRDVVVLGGGNVAVDAARCAARLGARVELVSLEARSEMPAFDWEIAEAQKERVLIRGGWGPVRVHAEGERVGGVVLKRCVSVLDEDGRFDPQFDERYVRERACDTVVIAVGQVPAENALDGLGRTPEGLLRVDPVTLATSNPRVFACGDLVPGSISIIDAVAGGRRAAIAIDRQLGGTGAIDDHRRRRTSRARRCRGSETAGRLRGSPFRASPWGSVSAGSIPSSSGSPRRWRWRRRSAAFAVITCFGSTRSDASCAEGARSGARSTPSTGALRHPACGASSFATGRVSAATTASRAVRRRP